MWVGLDRFGRLLIDTTLATAVLLSLVILLMLLCQQPARRILLARVAIVLALLMFPLTAAKPFAWSRAPSWLTARTPGVNLDTPGSRRQAITSPDQSGVSTWWQGPWPLRVLALVYLAGVLASLSWTLLGFWGIERLVGKSVDPSPATSAYYEELTRQMDERVSVPGLRVSLRINRPVVFGLFRTWILIPSAYDQETLDRESLRIILLHELAHAAQGDIFFSVAASLAQSLWFFLPFLWWLRAQLQIDHEFLADHKVVKLTGSPAGYATRLVTLAAASKSSRIRLDQQRTPFLAIQEPDRWRHAEPALPEGVDAASLSLPA